MVYAFLKTPRTDRFYKFLLFARRYFYALNKFRMKLVKVEGKLFFDFSSFSAFQKILVQKTSFQVFAWLL